MQVGAGPVHGDVAVALQQAHHAADLLDGGELLGTRHQRGQAALVQRVTTGPDTVGAAPEGRDQRLGVGIEPGQGVLHQSEEMLA